MLNIFAHDFISSLILIFYMFLIGVCLGSFSSAIAYRVSIGKSWIFDDNKSATRSYCPNCKHKLAWFDLIPFFSWLLLWGKCRYCKNKISPFYPIIELLGGVLSIFIFIIIDNIYAWFLLLFCLPTVLATFLIYYNKFTIPKMMLFVTIFFFSGIIFQNFFKYLPYVCNYLLKI